jgi:superfamily I DNA/RNA helicase
MFKGSVIGDPARIFISDKVENLIQYLDDAIQKFASEKIKDVVILTCATVEKSWLHPYLQNGKYKKHGLNVTVSTCRKFKGLEADAIILVDVVADTFDNYNKLMFYVGASRARFNLSVICNMSEEECKYAIAQLDAQSTKKPKKALAAALNTLLS